MLAKEMVKKVQLFRKAIIQCWFFFKVNNFHLWQSFGQICVGAILSIFKKQIIRGVVGALGGYMAIIFWRTRGSLRR